MIVGTGVDLLEIDRMERLLARHGPPAKVFAPEEIEACRAERFGPRRTAERLAGLFAAKEAVMKALGTGWSGGVAFTEIRIDHTEAGRPEVHLSGRAEAAAKALGADRVHLSITHAAGLALAFAVLERTSPETGPGVHGVRWDKEGS